MDAEKRKGLSAELQIALEPRLRAIESLSQQILDYNERMEQMARDSYPEIARLKQVKGVGTLLMLPITYSKGAPFYNAITTTDYNN